MGMGEPLANYAAVLRAVRRISDPVPDGSRDLAARDHGVDRRPGARRSGGWPPRACPAGSPSRCTRPTTNCATTLVPVNRRWKVAEVLDAAWDYAAATGRRVSIEYAMIRDINDQAWRADALARLLTGRLRAREPDPAEPDAGLEVDGVRP